MSQQRRKGGNDPFGDLEYDDLPPVPLSEGDMAVYGERAVAAPAPEPRLKVTKVGLQGHASTFEEWEVFGRTLKEIESGLQFAIGDWLLQGDKQWGNRYRGVAEALGFELATLWDFKYVAESVKISVRTEILKFGHHKLVAALDPNMQHFWLTRAAAGEQGKPWTLARMRDEMGDPEGTKHQSYDWYANWFAPKLDSIVLKARKATDAEKRLVAADLRRMADELEGHS